MTKIGADMNGKPADPCSVESGVTPPVIMQTVPEKVRSVPRTTSPNQNNRAFHKLSAIQECQYGMVQIKSKLQTIRNNKVDIHTIIATFVHL